MTHTHDVEERTHSRGHYHEGAGTGMATGVMVALVAVLVAALIAGLVLLVAQPWDGDGGAIDTPNVPGIEEPIDGGAGDADGSDAGGAGQ